MAPLLIFSYICEKCIVFGQQYFQTSQISGIIFYLMCVISANDNKTVAEWGYTNVSFTINSPLKILLCYFRYFHCSNINMTFVKNFMKNYLSSDGFSKFFQSFIISQNFVIWMLSKMTAACMKSVFFT